MATLNGYKGKYQYFPRFTSWRVYFFSEETSGPGLAYQKCMGIYSTREEAVRETYRLNGWGEPKPEKLRRRY